jgi:hypothetical protein
MRKLRKFWCWLFGDPGRYSGCSICCRLPRPGIFGRGVDWLVIQLAKIHGIRPVLSTYVDPKIKTVSVSHNPYPPGYSPTLDPVYRGTTKGEPIPPCFTRAPVMIPTREPIIPKTVTSPEDIAAVQATGVHPVFRRVVDAINPLMFEPITGARVSLGHSALRMCDGFVVELLAGEKKEPFGFLMNCRTGHIRKFATRASARSAKSRYLRRLRVR